MRNIVIVILGLIIGCAIAILLFFHGSSDKTELDIIDRTIKQGEEPAEWFACNQDSDCIYVDNDVCQFQGNGLSWRAVNKNFEEEFQAVQKSERAKNSICTEMYLLPPEQDPICSNNICTQPE